MTTQSTAHAHIETQADIPAILEQAEQAIRLAGGRFTTIRKHIFQILLEAPHPLGAYDIIDRLNGIGAQKPPTVYRALTWLIDHGLAAKIAFNSRYTAMPIGVEANDIAFMVCKACGDMDTLEAPGISQSLHQSAKDRGFANTQTVIEIIGLCGERNGSCNQ